MIPAVDKPRNNLAQARRQARRRALQALYQWELGGLPPAEIEQQFLAHQDMDKVDLGYFARLLHGVAEHCEALDGRLLPHLSWKPEQLDPVEREILRLGAFELVYCLETPVRVVINESVELAKSFGAEQSHKFVNGVLDKLARIERAVELGAG